MVGSLTSISAECDKHNTAHDKLSVRRFPGSDALGQWWGGGGTMSLFPEEKG